MYPDEGQLQIDAQNGDVQLIFCEQGLNQACLELPVRYGDKVAATPIFHSGSRTTTLHNPIIIDSQVFSCPRRKDEKVWMVCKWLQS